MCRSSIKFIIAFFLRCINFSFCQDLSDMSKDESPLCTESSSSRPDFSTEFAATVHEITASGAFQSGKVREARSVNATAFLDQMFGERLFNTTMNFIVPGAKVVLPGHTEEGNVDHLAMQAFFGMFWAIAWITTLAIPWATLYLQPFGIGRSLNDENGFHVRWKLEEKVAEQVGLKWKPCLKKTICQAHEFPQKYGLLGSSVRLLFPFTVDQNTRYGPSDEYDIAASTGVIEKNCGDTYKCFFDVLDVLLYTQRYLTWLPT